MRPPTPIANGIRTDHPVPGLPFINDSLLDLEDRSHIEAIGRHAGEGLWGRTDIYEATPGAWRAFTTDPENTNYAWLVVNHPTNGRSVTLYRDEDVAEAYSYRDYDNEGVIPLIVRAGGYWSDGDTWRRPTATRDPITGGRTWDAPEKAADWTALDARLDPLPGDEVHVPDPRSRTVANALPAAADDAHWRASELKAWENARASRDDALPLEQCTVEIIAPELTGTSLLGSAEAADMAGVGASTWRAYVARGTAPAPQRTRSGRPHWSWPIIEAYIARAERDAPRTLPSLPKGSASLAVDRIREDVYRAGRKAFKPMQTDALRNALSGQIIGLSSNHYVTESMHAAWLLHEFEEAKKARIHVLSPTVLDQIASLAWLRRYSAEEAVSMYVSRGVAAGHDRAELEDALLNAAPQGSEVQALIKEAVTPQWG